MRTFITLMAIAFALPGFAQTMEKRREKSEMIQRTKDLQKNAEDARKLFKLEKLEEGCAKVEFLFKNTPKHLTSIMSNMNILNRKVGRIQDEALDMLRSVHSMNNACKRGENQEKVDPDLFRDVLKDYVKKMKRHRNIIEDKSTDFDNSYYYSYEL